MSHLARELHRQLLWIEQEAKELMSAVEELAAAGNVLMSSTDGWDEIQAAGISAAIRDYADDCGRRIADARSDVELFRRELEDGGR